MTASGFGRQFERLADAYRKEDGSRWTPREIEEATKGFVSQPYLANLRAGRIRQPGFDKLRAISRAMDFPFSLWFEEPERWGSLAQEEERRAGPSLAERLNLLFDLVRHPQTGEPFTDAEVARMSSGHLTEEEVERLRGARLTDPTMAQLLSLSDAFGVDVSYWYLKPEKQPPLDHRTMDALRNEKSHLILNKIHGRSESEKDMILVMLEQLDRMKEGGGE